jgi:DNA polymerase-3 subunit beta
MKISVLQENLKTALTHVSKAVPAKPPIAILSSVFLEVHTTHLELAATDLYLGVKSQVLGSNQESGSLVVPGKLFHELISALPPGKIDLYTEGTTLIISSASGTTKLQGQASEDYPPFPTVEGSSYEISLEQLAAIDTDLRFSSGLDPTRVVLTALLFNFKPDSLEVVATDGFRLALEHFTHTENRLNHPILIPAKAVSEICRIAQVEKVEKIQFFMSEELKQLSFAINETQVFVRLIEGSFPPFEKIIPPDFAVEALWDGEEFASQLKRALIFARESSHIIKLELTPEELQIQASSSAHGTYVGKIPLQMIRGTQGSIAFNAKYIMDFMNTLKPDKIQFLMNESLKPALIRPQGKDTYSYIVMPFRVNE